MGTKKIEGQAEVLPVLALAAMENAGADADKVRALLVELMEETLEKRRKEKEKREKLALSSAQAAKEQAELKEREQARCSHRNQRGETRLSGQRLSNGVLCLVCKYCGKEYHDPAGPGQTRPPRELYPPVDEIGG